MAERKGHFDNIIGVRRSVHDVLMDLTPTGEVLQGNLNQNHGYVDREGKKYLHRVEKERTIIIDKMMHSYHEIGFTAHGGVLGYLTSEEQAQKMWKMEELGLKTLVPVAADGDEMILPFVEGQSLESYINSGQHAVVPAVLDHLMLAHTKGIVLGDRWTSNTMVTPDEDFVELDFDIDLTGNNAAEFELAQFMYHTILYSPVRDTMVSSLQDHVTQRRDALEPYNKGAIADFMHGHVRFYDGVVDHGYVNNIGPEVDHVLSLI